MPPGPGGTLPTEAMIAALDDTVRVLAVASVSFSPGARADLQRLGQACRARGILLLVDGAQSVGILHTDVERDMVDVLVTSTQKGLTGLYGLGFLYVCRAWAEQMVCGCHLARFGISMEGRHEADHDATSVPVLAPGARRFEVGNPNFPALVAAKVAMSRILDTGPAAIEQKALSLAALLRARLSAAGLPIVNAESGGKSHILTVGAPDFPAASLHAFLDGKDIKASLTGRALSGSLFTDTTTRPMWSAPQLPAAPGRVQRNRFPTPEHDGRRVALPEQGEWQKAGAHGLPVPG